MTTTVAVDTRTHAVVAEQTELPQNSRGHSVAVADKEDKQQQNGGNAVAKQTEVHQNFRGHLVAVADKENKLQRNGGGTAPENELIMKYYPNVCCHCLIFLNLRN